MTVKQLKEQLIGIPDEAFVLVPGSDHSYYHAAVDVTTAMVYRSRAGLVQVVEDHGDGHNDPGGIRVPAMVFSGF